MELQVRQSTGAYEQYWTTDCANWPVSDEAENNRTCREREFVSSAMDYTQVMVYDCPVSLCHVVYGKWSSACITGAWLIKGWLICSTRSTNPAAIPPKPALLASTGMWLDFWNIQSLGNKFLAIASNIVTHYLDFLSHHWMYRCAWQCRPDTHSLIYPLWQILNSRP